MRISELSSLTGIPVPSIKYYLREGLLTPGEARGATQADYSDGHVKRLRLIRALADIAGLPITQIKRVLTLIDEPSDDLFATLGQAVAALPPYGQEHPEGERPEYPQAKAALEHLGWIYDPSYAATAHLDRAISAVADAGIPLSEDRLDAYGAALHAVGEFDLRQMPGVSSSGLAGRASASASSSADSGNSGPGESPGASAAVEYAVLGTALYEPVVVALRRLAHMDIAARALGCRSPW